MTNELNQLQEARIKRELYLNGLQTKGISIKAIRKRFGDFISLIDRLTQHAKRNIINILLKEIIITYPVDSKKGTIKIKAWNKPSQTFKYDAKRGVCFTSSSYPPGTKT